MGFRAGQIATLTGIAAAAALATSASNTALLVRMQIRENWERSELLARTLYHQASRVLRQEGRAEPRQALASDAGLRRFSEAVVGYSPISLYVAILDDEGVAIFHSDPLQEGRRPGPADSLEAFSERNPLHQCWVLGRGHGVLAADLPFSLDGVEPFGAVRVAVSTLLLRRQLLAALATNAAISAGVVLAAFLASLYLAKHLLAPLERLRDELARIDTGADRPRLDLSSKEDVGRVAEFFASVSQRLAERRPGGDRTWLRTMLGGLADAVLVLSRDRRILSLTDAASRFFGRARAELEGQPLDRVLAADHPLRSLIDEALECDEAVAPRTLGLAIGAREVPHLVSAQVLREADHVLGVMVTARNLQRWSRLGSQLSYSQKLVALGQLTSGVAHEIKNPLNALVMHLALLRRKLADRDPQAPSHLDVLDEEVRRLDRVVEGFLRFTRPEELRLEAVRIETVIDGLLRLVAARADQAGIRVEADLRPDLPSALGSAELLRQALLNLVTNALDATPRGGKIRVSAGGSEEGALVVAVEDTGHGIAPEALPRIFNLYYTTKDGGDGIGLSLVYRIVQLHGGEIGVESQPGEGTRFTITLPEVSA